MTVKKICTWNAMISALSTNGQVKQALDLFQNLEKEGFTPNCVTFVTILAACARGKFVEYGLKVFQSMSADFGVVPVMEHYGCIVDLLGKAGFLREATMFVKNMPFEPDASVLGALFGAYAIHGISELENDVQKRLLCMQPQQHSEPYINLSNINANMQKWDHAAGFRRMMLHASIQKIPALSIVCKKVEPNETSFRSMERDNKLRPIDNHYASFVDFLSRAKPFVLKKLRHWLNKWLLNLKESIIVNGHKITWNTQKGIPSSDIVKKLISSKVLDVNIKELAIAAINNIATHLFEVQIRIRIAVVTHIDGSPHERVFTDIKPRFADHLNTGHDFDRAQPKKNRRSQVLRQLQPVGRA
ncbi:hypothetical protein F8388_013418 [Cannabis sativa]|nr:hypothetical protein F8388_013418 [Cannabis sativa]